MPEFYEIHDSKIESLAWDGTALELTLYAVCTVSNGVEPLSYGRQRILLRFENATLTGDKAEPEIWLLEGKFECESEDSIATGHGNGCIVASLGEAKVVHMHLFGRNEETIEYPTFDVRSESMTLRKLGPVDWSKGKQLSSGRRIIGMGAFDSGIGDLATNKAHMKGFGLSSKTRRELGIDPPARQK